MAAQLPTPLQFQRLGAFPLDGSAVFPTLAALETYALDTDVAYVGQICAVAATGGVDVYVITQTRAVRKLASSLSDLADVSVAGKSGGDVLRYNGTAWANYAETELTDGGNF